MNPTLVSRVTLLLLIPLTLTAAQDDGESLSIPNSAGVSTNIVGDELHFELKSATEPAEIRLPRLNNNVYGAYWKSIDAPSETFDPPALSGSEYLAPVLPAASQHLAFSQTPTEWRIQLNNKIQYPATVILRLVGPATFAPEGHVCQPDGDGSIVLPAKHAQVTGEKIQFEPLTHKNTVGYWVNANEFATWKFKTTQNSKWDVHILQGCGAGQGGSLIQLDFGSQQLQHRVVETGHFQNFRWKRIGQVELATDSEQSLKVTCEKLSKNAVMDLRQIRLIPSDAKSTPVKRLAQTSPDCEPPAIRDGEPAAGKRVISRLPDSASSQSYHSVYLPTNWNSKTSFPVLVEWGGNGPYENRLGDRNSGRVEDGLLGYGLGGNDGYIWICLPYLNSAGTHNVSQWWGTPPDYSPKATLEYAQKAIADVCEKFNGDRERLVLIGFSRGAIACNHLGLYNDDIAKLWKGFVCFSHYDGVRTWPMPSSDAESARQRLKRLGIRPQWILSESVEGGQGQLAQTREFLGNPSAEQFHLMETGIINHDDDWALRPNPTRQAVRSGLQKLLGLTPRDESL
jgi:hypothetical protein